MINTNQHKDTYLEDELSILQQIIESARFELAALLERPNDTNTFDQWPVMNNADAECLEKAYKLLEPRS